MNSPHLNIYFIFLYINYDYTNVFLYRAWNSDLKDISIKMGKSKIKISTF